MQYELLYKRVSAHKSNTLRFYSSKHLVFVCTYVRLCVTQHRTHACTYCTCVHIVHSLGVYLNA